MLFHSWTALYWSPLLLLQSTVLLCTVLCNDSCAVVQVQRTYIHHTAIPWSGGVDLPVRELWHSHFKRLIQPSRACSQQRERNDGLNRVTSLADIAARARQCAREGFTNEVRKGGPAVERVHFP